MRLSRYPKAYEKRLHAADPLTRAPRLAVPKAAGINFVMLQILFLGLFCYIMGSLFHTNSNVRNMKILYIDNDQGSVGDSVRQAYRTLQSPQFPTLVEKRGSDFTLPGHSPRDEVCQTNNWAALYTTSGASQRLEAAVSGGPSSANYNASNTLIYIWNEARYPATSDSYIVSNLQTLSSIARSVYISCHGSLLLNTSSSSINPLATLSVLANPWSLSSINIQPTSQGAHLIYNTLVIILLMIQEFFFLNLINFLHTHFKIWPRLFPRRIYTFRLLISLLYTLIGSLCVTASIWSFRASWHVNSAQFVLSWLALWLFAHVNFLTLDIFSVWLPEPVVPMALITWLVLNITSILLPFELASAFYRIRYVMPAHAVYRVLMDVWSGGCDPQLYYALPVLFAEEVAGLLLSAIGVYRRCHYALLAEENQEEALRKKVEGIRNENSQAAPNGTDAATEEEAKDDGGRGDELGAKAEAETQNRPTVGSSGSEETLRREDTAASVSVGVGFGPSFGVA
ncbi:MAG: hypothetical protein Q9160_008447 [Pyrenula sp. 1 TL-2023]